MDSSKAVIVLLSGKVLFQVGLGAAEMREASERMRKVEMKMLRWRKSETVKVPMKFDIH